MANLPTDADRREKGEDIGGDLVRFKAREARKARDQCCEESFSW